ncbi:MAG TPA: mannose-1-phosphate guanyltransferase [Bacillota bacterium]|nr:mannose-1-phosphate guanyltransferase [Bacillota bacterium]
MKAVIMAGGKGTRLRPLSCGLPKPMVPIANRPMMEQIMGLLKRHGFEEVVATLYYLPETIQNYFGDGREQNVELSYRIEERPLGTAGSVRNAKDFLDDTFIVVSGDALTDIDLGAAIRFHREHGAIATLVLTKVKNPLEYGVVVTEPNGKIRRFLEKPGWGEVFSDTVNTGIYVLEPEIFSYFHDDEVFDFSKDLFPRILASGGPLYGYIADGYWSDIGNLEQYRQAHYDLLSGKINLVQPGQEIFPGVWAGEGAEIEYGAEITGPVYLGDYTKIRKGARIEPYTVIGAHGLVQNDASIKRSILWNHVYIGDGCEIRGAILANRCHLKGRVSIFEGAVLGEGCTVGTRTMINSGVKVWPDKQVESGSTLRESLVWGNRGARALFGNLGIEGTINVEMTPEFAAKLGAAYGSVIGAHAQVVLGTDSFKASRVIKRAFSAGLLSAGIDLFDLGTVAMPVTRYAVGTLGVKGGIQVRLSPSRPTDVLLEFIDEKGLNIPKSLERNVENAFFGEDFARVSVEEMGDVAFVPRLIHHYLDGILQSASIQTIRNVRFRIVANYDAGTLSLLLPTLLERLGCQVIHGNQVDENTEGRPKTLKEILAALDFIGQQVAKEKADFGIVVDNNAERLILVDEKGELVKDEQFLALLSMMVLKYSTGETVAVPVTAPRIIEEMAREYNGKVIRTKADPRSLMEKVAQERIFPTSDGKNSYQPAFDALISLVKILELMAQEGVRLSDLIQMIPPVYTAQREVVCPWEQKGRVMRNLFEENKDRDLELIDGLKVFHNDGWALVLPDAAEPVFRVYSESSSQEEADALTEMYMGRITELQME